MAQHNHSTNDEASMAEWQRQFERATRQLRWIVLLGIAVSFPHDRSRLAFVVVTLVAASLYNLSRYSKRLLSNRIMASPLVTILTDATYVGILIVAVGSARTAYSTLFVYMIITMAYRFGLWASLALSAAVCAWLVVVQELQFFPPIELSNARSLVIFAFFLIGMAVLSYRLVYIDLHERQTLRRLRLKSETERKHLSVFVNSMTEAIFVIDAEGMILLHNMAAGRLVDIEGGMKSRHLSEVLPLFARKDVEAKPVDLLAESNGNQRRRDLCFTRRGHRVDLSITIKQVNMARQDEFIVICDDITGERSLDEQKSEFISVASHELRTPIAIMEAALSTVLHSTEQMPEQTRQLIDQAHQNAIYLADIMKDLSTLSEARNDNLPIQISQVDPTSLIKYLSDGFRLQVENKGLELIATVDPATPVVMSTERHIREILQNFLTNSIKYTETGTIRLSAEPSAGGGVRFAVSDTGAGISPKDQEYLFVKFFRAGDYRISKTNGTGLGLYLCRELAERIGGKVWCDSELDAGSTFYLEVPPFSGASNTSST